MQEVNQTLPERMTPEQRRREIASILASGVIRLRMSDSRQSAGNGIEREISLAFSGHQSVHSDPANNQHTES